MRSFFKNIHFVSLFFIALCFFSIAMTFILGSYRLKSAESLKNVSRFEVWDFKYFKITQKGVYTIANGKKARENERRENEIEQLDVSNYTQSESRPFVAEHLRADFALYDNQNIFFPQGVHYERDAMRFWSQEAMYNPNLKALEGFGEFVILENNYKIRGNNIAYKDGKITAKDIHGILKERP